MTEAVLIEGNAGSICQTFFERLPSGTKSAAVNLEIIVRFRMYWRFSGTSCAPPFPCKKCKEASTSNGTISK